MWSFYEAGTLSLATVLTGEFDEPEEEADVGGILREIEAARLDEDRRQAGRADAEAPPNKAEEPPPPWMQ
jgi:RIO kinase 1